MKEKDVEEQIAKLKNEQMDHVAEENEIRKNLAISQFKFDVAKWQELKGEKNWLTQVNSRTDIRNKYETLLEEELTSIVEEIKYIG